MKMILGHFQKKKTVEEQPETILFKHCLTYTLTPQFSSISNFKKERSIDVCVRFQTCFFLLKVKIIYLSIILSGSFSSPTLFLISVFSLFHSVQKATSIYTHAIYLVLFCLCLPKFRCCFFLSVCYLTSNIIKPQMITFTKAINNYYVITHKNAKHKRAYIYKLIASL